ncbi:MAG: cyclic nucleotide-binding domain-containing protein, partial [Acidobacteriota bacterium]
MPRVITHHSEIIEAIRNSGIISELLETQDNHFKYELDLELIVYGRTYADKRVGPYARLLIYPSGEEIIHEGDWGGNTFYILIDGRLDVYVNDEAGVSRRVGEIEVQNGFGEMSVLAGQPRNATVVVPSGETATVLEIQRPALRLLRKLSKFGDRLEHGYRQHGLDRTLLEVQEATGDSFSAELLKELKQAARFTVYGKDHVLFLEGDAIDKLLFVNSGWVRRVRGLASNLKLVHSLAANPILADVIMELDQEVGLDFLGGGNWLGLEAISGKDKTAWSYTATIMARTEVLELSIAQIQSNPALVRIVSEYFPQFSEVDDNPPAPPSDKRSAQAAAKEIGTGVVDGTNLLVMDMDLCIRCGNCSLACHKVHGQSRLLRRGIHIARPIKPQGYSIQHVLLPSVCLHCQDPECLTGCPTGAIARFSQGHIDIDPETCIGCADCATQCPYNAIT